MNLSCSVSAMAFFLKKLINTVYVLLVFLAEYLHKHDVIGQRIRLD